MRLLRQRRFCHQRSNETDGWRVPPLGCFRDSSPQKKEIGGEARAEDPVVGDQPRRRVQTNTVLASLLALSIVTPLEFSTE